MEKNKFDIIVIGAGSAAYSADEQKKLADKAAKQRETARINEQNRIDAIARDTRPDEEGVTNEIDFGSSTDGTGGSYNDFIVDNNATSTALSSYGRQGLGFAQ